MRKAALFLMLFLIFFTAGCGVKPRTPVTAKEFVDKLEAAGFTLVDAVDQFDEGLVEAAYIAIGENYQIEFFIVPTVEQAQRAFAENQATFEAAKGNSTTNKSAKAENFSYYCQTSNGKYSVVSRTDNTFIYVDADSEYKQEINDIIKDLGY